MTAATRSAAFADMSWTARPDKLIVSIRAGFGKSARPATN
jgi:hypothetical protein